MGSSSMVAAQPAFWSTETPWRLTRCLSLWGHWFILACQWLPLPGVYGLEGHSLVFRYTPETPRALFVESEDHAGEISTPEVMPRPDGITYVCGLSGEAPLPVDPAHVGTEEGGPEKLRAMISIRPRAGCRRSRFVSSMLPTRHARQHAGNRRRHRRGRRLYGDRSQRLGHAKRHGDRRGHGGTDRRWRCLHGGHFTLRTRTATGPRCGCTLRTKLRLPLLSVR